MKYEITWYETRTFRCHGIYEAESSDEAKEIVLEPGCENVRDWTDKEREEYSEHCAEVMESGIIDVVNLST